MGGGTGSTGELRNRCQWVFNPQFGPGVNSMSFSKEAVTTGKLFYGPSRHWKQRYEAVTVQNPKPLQTVCSEERDNSLNGCNRITDETVITVNHKIHISLLSLHRELSHVSYFGGMNRKQTQDFQGFRNIQ